MIDHGCSYATECGYYCELLGYGTGEPKCENDPNDMFSRRCQCKNYYKLNKLFIFILLNLRVNFY